MPFYKLTERSFINLAVQEAGAVVDINDDPSKGGMRPGKNLVPCNEDGSERKLRKLATPTDASKVAKEIG